MHGTPEFIGERLTEAREVRRINQTELAELLGISRQMVSQYEHGKKSPAPDTLEAIAGKLRFPVHRFTKPIEDSSGALFFRSLTASTKSARTRAQRRHSWLADDICGYLKSVVQFVPVNFPDFSVPDDPSRIETEDIEYYADELRRFWGLSDGPISDVVLLIENNGGIVARQELAANTLDAFSEWHPQDQRPYIILGVDKASAVRSRWDAAHEVGHMVLHRHLRPNRTRQPEVYKMLEEQAHYFAGAFLLPLSSFGREARSMSLNSFITLKSRWRVSVAGMIRRLYNLGRMSDATRKRLHTYMSMKGWHKNEPFDKEWEPEQPRFIQRAFDLVLNEGVASVADLESEIGIFADDIESTAGLESGFLGRNWDNFKFPTLTNTG